LTAATILQKAEEMGISLTVQTDGKIRITGPKPPVWLLEAIPAHRAELAAILAHSVGGATTSTANSPSAAKLCHREPFKNWRVRRHPGAGRTVFFDPEWHDGELVRP